MTITPQVSPRGDDSSVEGEIMVRRMGAGCHPRLLGSRGRCAPEAAGPHAASRGWVPEAWVIAVPE